MKIIAIGSRSMSRDNCKLQPNPTPKFPTEAEPSSCFSCRRPPYSDNSLAMAAMGSSMLVSSKLIRPDVSAYAYACRRNLHEIERESERERKYLVQLRCKRTPSSTYFTLLSTPNWAPVQKFVEPYFDTWNDVTGSCHGLLHFAGEEGDDLIWMPSTNKFKVLAPSKVPRSPRMTSIYFGSIGFGFDSKSQDYKIVRDVVNCDDEDHACSYYVAPQMELYSLKTDSWKEILEFPADLHGGKHCARVNVNGSLLYWCSTLFTREPDYIFSYDFTTEEFSWLPPPPPDQTTCFQFCILVEVDGKLGIMIYDLNGRFSKWGLELFVLGDDGKSWLKEFDIYGLVGVRRPVLYDSDAHLLFIEGDGDKDLWVYDILTAELKQIGLSDEFRQVIPYVVSPVVSASAPWA